MKSILLVALIFTGCASAPKRTVFIESDPPGARIYFGEGANEGEADKRKTYAGTTPCNFTPPSQNGGGEFERDGLFLYSEFVATAHIFFAEPASAMGTNLFKKRVVFHGPASFSAGDKVPEKLFFDLTKPD